MAKTKQLIFISLEAIPEAELSYLPKLCEEPLDRFFKVTRGFLEYLAKGKVTIEGLAEHLRELETVQFSDREAAALAVAAYEHASALGLTDHQRGAWFYNLMILGCDPKSVKQAVQTSHDLRKQGLANTPKKLAEIVAKHFSTRYLHLAVH